MAAVLEQIYGIALQNYHMKLLAGEAGLNHLADWVHVVEEPDYIEFLKGQELIVTTGMKLPDEETLLTFTEKIYNAGACGLVINTGRYIPKVPKKVLIFGAEHSFPVFSLPWEVHLVEFNRELCNLIYRTEQEYDSLDSAVQKLIFNPGEANQYTSFFHSKGITGETPVRLLQCCYIFPEQKEHAASKEEEDIARFYFRFVRHCHQILSAQRKKYVVFHYDRYVTAVLFERGEKEIYGAAEQILGFRLISESPVRITAAVSGADTSLKNLSEKYRNMSLLCRRNIHEKQLLCREDDMKVWKLLLDIPGQSRLKEYEEQVLGELVRIDAETGSEYCRVLQTYLEENGNIQEVASRCFLHRNTVSSYLKKIGEITGKKLNRAEDRNELYLAFQIREILKL